MSSFHSSLLSTLTEGGDETSPLVELSQIGCTSPTSTERGGVALPSAGFLQVGCTSLGGTDSLSVRALGLLLVDERGLCTQEDF